MLITPSTPKPNHQNDHTLPPEINALRAVRLDISKCFDAIDYEWEHTYKPGVPNSAKRCIDYQALKAQELPALAERFAQAFRAYAKSVK